MNYELLGNGDSHIHWHLFSRYDGDLGNDGDDGCGPVWWLPKEEMWKDKYKPTLEELVYRTNESKNEIKKIISR